MRLCRQDEVPEQRVFATFKTSALPGALMLIGLWTSTGAAAWWLATETGSWSAWGWLLLAPFALGFGALLVVLDLLALGALRAALRRTNWLMKLSAEGAYLNLRCYLNGERGEQEDSVAMFDFDELHSARRVLLVNRNGGSDGLTMTLERYLELEVDQESTAELDLAVKRELARAGVTRETLGVSVTTKANGSPVIVAGPGRVRVRWTGARMLRALAAEGVELASNSRLDEDGEPFDPSEVDDRLLELCQRGRTVEAVSLARRAHSLSLREARDFVQGLAADAAA